jgi:quercetin dioxygenase-like cupin family protein
MIRVWREKVKALTGWLQKRSHTASPKDDPIMRSVFALLLILSAPALAAEAPAAKVSPLTTQALANAPGQSLTAVTVNYPPGGKSAAHRHPGSVFVYVVSGKVRSLVSTNGPVKVFGPGETFFEPEGSTHMVSENASDSEPASILAVFVAPTGATLTMPAMPGMK